MVNKRGRYRIRCKKILVTVGLLVLIYSLTCFIVFIGQRHLIYRPHLKLSMLPSDPVFNLSYENVWIPIANSDKRLHGWWISAPILLSTPTVLPNDPVKILKSPKVMLYLCGVGRNMGDYNYLARVAAFHQLGFDVLVFDYRGYGNSEGNFPSEKQLYEDSQAAWDYLRQFRQIPPEQIAIYGESLGGAIALDLTIKVKNVAFVIIQSSFTKLAEVIKYRMPFSLLPVDLLLTEHFDSLSKVKALQVPVLFIHGLQDSVVPPSMSQRLYNAAPEPKQLFLIPGADHVKIYKPGDKSYLRAIQTFITFFDSVARMPLTS